MKKPKITIMKAKPELTDEEIRSYMDFDGLVARSKLAARPSIRARLLKYGVPALVISGLALWFALSNLPSEQVDVTAPVGKTSPPISHEQTQEQAAVEVEPPVADTRGSDKGGTPDRGNTPTRILRETPSKDSKANVSSGRPETNDQITAEPSVQSAYQQAEPVDGYSALYSYFNSALIYPPESVKDSIQGVQTVRFTISAQGKPEDIQVIDPLGPPFEREAVRLIQNMPPWKPAVLDGKPVASQVSIPLTFQIKSLSIK